MVAKLQQLNYVRTSLGRSDLALVCKNSEARYGQIHKSFEPCGLKASSQQCIQLLSHVPEKSLVWKLRQLLLSRRERGLKYTATSIGKLWGLATWMPDRTQKEQKCKILVLDFWYWKDAVFVIHQLPSCLILNWVFSR